MSDDYELHRTLGRLEAQVSAHAAQLTSMDEKLDTVLLHVARQRATFRTLAKVGSVATALGAGIVHAAHLLWDRT